MRRIMMLGLAACALAGFVSSTAAEARNFCGYHPRSINQRLGYQERRINSGFNNGSLSLREDLRLQRNEARIAAQAYRFRQSNGMQPWEHRKLENELNRESRLIYREKHD